MALIKDIRPIKLKLRKEAKEKRLALTKEYKKLADTKIKNKVLNLWATREADTVLCYVSTDIEVDTKELITSLLASGKKVAVPKCRNENGEMDFYYINSFNDLERGFFGVLEPKSNCEIYKVAEKSICIVPAFMFDKSGFRLGYGKGYYDRFLSDFSGTPIGICYDADITENLFHGRYDKNVNIIVTDKRILNI